MKVILFWTKMQLLENKLNLFENRNDPFNSRLQPFNTKKMSNTNNNLKNLEKPRNSEVSVDLTKDSSPLAKRKFSIKGNSNFKSGPPNKIEFPKNSNNKFNLAKSNGFITKRSKEVVVSKDGKTKQQKRTIEESEYAHVDISDDSDNEGKLRKDKIFKFHDVPIRGKARKLIPGVECEQCKTFYDAIDKDGVHFDRKLFVCEHSRHRPLFEAPGTPPDFWNVDFPLSPEKKQHKTQEDEST